MLISLLFFLFVMIRWYIWWAHTFSYALLLLPFPILTHHFFTFGHDCFQTHSHSRRSILVSFSQWKIIDAAWECRGSSTSICLLILIQSTQPPPLRWWWSCLFILSISNKMMIVPLAWLWLNWLVYKPGVQFPADPSFHHKYSSNTKAGFSHNGRHFVSIFSREPGWYSCPHNPDSDCWLYVVQVRMRMGRGSRGFVRNDLANPFTVAVGHRYYLLASLIDWILFGCRLLSLTFHCCRPQWLCINRFSQPTIWPVSIHPFQGSALNLSLFLVRIDLVVFCSLFGVWQCSSWRGMWDTRWIELAVTGATKLELEKANILHCDQWSSLFAFWFNGANHGDGWVHHWSGSLTCFA